MNKKKPYNILIIAEAANPEWTSVPLLGWLHTLALSKVCNVHLVTQIRNKEAIERTGWREGVEFTAIDSEKVIAPISKLAASLQKLMNGGWTINTALTSIAYPYFEHLCWKRFKSELKDGRFDIVHRLTPVSPTSPSPLAKKLSSINVPFVLGPLNGGVPWPPQFRDLQHKENEWLSYVRGVYKLLPSYAATRKHASAIIAGSMATKSQLPAKYKDKILYLPENAVDKTRFSLVNESMYKLPLRAVFVGRLVPYKGADMAIEAMEDLLKTGKMIFDVYGNGPEEQNLRQLVKSKGLEQQVTLHGFVPNDKLAEKLVKADLLVFPSIREFGGGVILESMTLGVVPVIADYAGPSELVSEGSGYKVPIGTRNELVNAIRVILERICENPLELKSKRSGALARVAKYYTWERKVEQDIQIYDWISGIREKPSLEEPFT